MNGSVCLSAWELLALAALPLAAFSGALKHQVLRRFGAARDDDVDEDA